MDTDQDRAWRTTRAAEMLVEGRRITSVYVWQNDMVMVFDQYGHQMEAYQGHIDDVREMIRRDAPPTATFQGGQWRVRDSLHTIVL